MGVVCFYTDCYLISIIIGCNVCIHVFVHVCIYVHLHVKVHVSVYMGMFVCACAFVYVYMCVSIYMYVCIWRPEAAVGTHLPLLFQFIYQKRYFRSNPELIDMASLTLEMSASAFQIWIIGELPRGSWGPELWPSHLSGKCFNCRTISSAPGCCNFNLHRCYMFCYSYFATIS